MPDVQSASKNVVSWFLLAAICAGILFLAVPSIGNNIGDPNMIAYFSTDEGGLMDEVWHYYSGVKRPSFQWDFDYGLEMVYLAGLGRIIISACTDLTPGSFVLILRWLHLVSWILALCVLWRLIGRHFQKGWQPVAAVLLVATRPAFVYFTGNLKPEPLVLLFMIAGLDLALTIVDKPSRLNLFLAVAMAACAFLVKFAGLFLLPAIVASLYFSRKTEPALAARTAPRLGWSWIFPALVGAGLMLFPLLPIIFYVRKSTGSTWFQQYGLGGSIAHNQGVYLIWAAGTVLILLSLAILLLGRGAGPFRKRATAFIAGLNSDALLVSAIFIACVLCFGLYWVLHPKHFISIYGQFGPIAFQKGQLLSGITHEGVAAFLFHTLASRAMAFDPFVFFFLVFYACVELCYRKRNLADDRVRMFKRLVIAVFIAPALPVIFSTLRMESHNMLPFVAAASVLAVQGVHIFSTCYTRSPWIKMAVLGAAMAVLSADVAYNAFAVKAGMERRLSQSGDVAFDIARWWKLNIPRDARVVADHYTRAYIPPEHENVMVLHWNQMGKTDQLRDLVSRYRPRFVYYNDGIPDIGALPPLEKILPERRMKVVARFDSAGKSYRRNGFDSFVVYELLD